MNKTYLCPFLKKYLLITSYMHRTLLGIERNNDGQTDLPSPHKTHKTPGLHAGEGTLKIQGTGEELKKENQETVEWSYKSQKKCFQREDNLLLQGNQVKQELRCAHLATRRLFTTLPRTISLEYRMGARTRDKGRQLLLKAWL